MDMFLRYYRIPAGIYDTLMVTDRIACRKTQPPHRSLHQHEPGVGFIVNAIPGEGVDNAPSRWGGAVECILSTGDTVVKSMSYCSLVDEFDYRLGREIAVGRSLKALGGKEVAHAVVVPGIGYYDVSVDGRVNVKADLDTIANQ